jgi:predicted nucleotidyltransferase
MTEHDPELPYPTILRATVGSTVHGLNVGDGIDDRDEMGVCIEDYADACGLDVPFAQFVFRSAAIREDRQDAKSQAGDLDLTVYSLRKYLRLALKGNPTVTLLLFAPPMSYDARGGQLRELAPYIVSKRTGIAFLGYLETQRQRLLGERGQKDVNRPELVAKYGYDTKYAMHLLRLGFQGVELMETGRLSLPMREPERTWLRGVRTGSAALQDVLTKAGELRTRLRDLTDTSPLRQEPDLKRVEAWMLRTYSEVWKAREFRARL